MSINLKSYLLSLLFFIISCPSFSQVAIIPYGEGSIEKPYLISSLENLYWIAQNSSKWDKNYKQTIDINASDTKNWDDGDGREREGFKPLGNNETKFSGTYDGNGHIIDSLFINRSEGNQAFFGVTRNATISNLGLTNVTIKGDFNIGAIVGYHTKNSLLISCFSSGTIECISNKGKSMGGLVGNNDESTISNCYSLSDVIIERYGMVNWYKQFFGGLVGTNWNARIENCYSTGLLIGDADFKGGLIGSNNNSEVINSFWDVDSSGIGLSQGGLGLKTEELKIARTFYEVGWDFVEDENGNDNGSAGGLEGNGDNNYWDMNQDGNHYPILSWQDGEQALITDLTSPTIKSISPIKGSIDVSNDGNLIIEFNDQVDFYGGVLTFKKYNNDEYLDQFYLYDDYISGIGTQSISIDPPSDLRDNVHMYVQIDGAAITDIYGNSATKLIDKENWHFTTKNMKVGIISLLSPHHQSKNLPLSPVLSWFQPSGATGDVKYEIQVATHKDFNKANLVFNDTIRGQTDKKISGLDYGKTYYWRVKGIKNENDFSDFSQVYEFTTRESQMIPVFERNDINFHTGIFKDLDNDKDLDIIFYEYVEPAIIWPSINQTETSGYHIKYLESVNYLEFEEHDLKVLEYKPSVIIVNDFEGDGDQDIFLVEFSKLTLLENDGKERFIYKELYDNQTHIQNINIFDVDLDNDMDMIVKDAHGLYLLEHDNLFSFNKSLIQSESTNINLCIDIDNDGFYDLLSSNNNQLFWYKNQNGDHFTKIIIDNKFNDFQLVNGIDIESDGDIDIIIYSQFQHSVFWYENTGNIFLDKKEICNGIMFPKSLSDIDGDGYVDLIIRSLTSGYWWCRNVENITTERRFIYNQSDAQVNIMDFNNDSNIDILIGSNLFINVPSKSFPLTSPELIYPSNTSYDLPLGINFNWNQVNGALKYDLELSTSYDLIENLITISDLTETSYLLNGLIPSRKYYWRIRAKNEHYESFSTVYEFYTTNNSNIEVVNETQTLAFVPTQPSKTSSLDYRLVSFPCNMNSSIINGEIKNPPVVSDFIQDGIHGKEWVIYRDNGLSNYYKESLDPHIQLTNTGEGFWLIKSGGLTVPSIISQYELYDNCLEIEVNSYSWNIIGNPFNQEVLLVSLQEYNYNLGTFWEYTSSGYVQATKLEPYKGYYYYETNGLNLIIPYPGYTIFSENSKTVLTSKENWQIQIELKTQFNQDNYNFIGVNALASKELDKYDSYKPPMFEDQGYVVFYRPEWDNKYYKFSSDIKPEFEDGEIWEFSVDNSSGTATLKFNFDNVPGKYKVILVDSLNTNLIELADRKQYEYYSTLSSHPFKLIVGTEKFIADNSTQYMQDKFDLLQNYPNPFNPITTIGYKLKELSKVQLHIYNVLGQKVKTIVNKHQEAGKYYTSWDATNFSSGVYFYQLIINGRPFQVRKMLLIK